MCVGFMYTVVVNMLLGLWKTSVSMNGKAPSWNQGGHLGAD